MRERAAELGGTCTVEPRPGGGTCVHADDCNSAARVGRYSRANTVRAKALALSVRRWRWGVRPFDEAKDFGFFLTEEGERIYVHRSGFLPGETLVGGARRAVRLTATVQNGKRVAIDVSMAPEVAHGGGATAPLEHSLRVAVMCR
jgi:cold shock CspA family protein